MANFFGIPSGGNYFARFCIIYASYKFQIGLSLSLSLSLYSVLRLYISLSLCVPLYVYLCLYIPLISLLVIV